MSSPDNITSDGDACPTPASPAAPLTPGSSPKEAPQGSDGAASSATGLPAGQGEHGGSAPADRPSEWTDVNRPRSGAHDARASAHETAPVAPLTPGPPPREAPLGSDDAANLTPAPPADDGADGGVTQRRVAHIVGLMLAFKFTRGKTAKRLAKKWDLSLDYVHQLTAKANKIVRAQAADPDEIAADVLPALRVALRKAIENGDPKSLACVAPLSAQMLDVAGLKAAKRTELTGKDGGAIQYAGPMFFLPQERDDDGDEDDEPSKADSEPTDLDDDEEGDESDKA